MSGQGILAVAPWPHREQTGDRGLLTPFHATDAGTSFAISNYEPMPKTITNISTAFGAVERCDTLI